MLRNVLQSWIFWMVAAAAAQGLRAFYLEFKIGELMGVNSLETRMLDGVRREHARAQAMPMLLITLPGLAVMVAASYWMAVDSRSVVFLFVGIAFAGLELLKDLDQRRLLKTAERLRPVLWQLDLLTGLGFVLNIGAAYSFSAYGLS